MKRMRRKQSNRESARRSRLRKQAENEQLNSRVHEIESHRNRMVAENASLKQTLEQLNLLVGKLSQDKAALIAQVSTALSDTYLTCSNHANRLSTPPQHVAPCLAQR